MSRQQPHQNQNLPVTELISQSYLVPPWLVQFSLYVCWQCLPVTQGEYLNVIESKIKIQRNWFFPQSFFYRIVNREIINLLKNNLTLNLAIFSFSTEASNCCQVGLWWVNILDTKIFPTMYQRPTLMPPWTRTKKSIPDLNMFLTTYLQLMRMLQWSE